MLSLPVPPGESRTPGQALPSCWRARPGAATTSHQGLASRENRLLNASGPSQARQDWQPCSEPCSQEQKWIGRCSPRLLPLPHSTPLPRPRFLPRSLESQEKLAFSSDKPFQYFFPSLNVKASSEVLSSLVRSRLRLQGRKGRTRQDLEEGGAWAGHTQQTARDNLGAETCPHNRR